MHYVADESGGSLVVVYLAANGLSDFLRMLMSFFKPHKA
jgi:hypothetical protein